MNRTLFLSLLALFGAAASTFEAAHADELLDATLPTPTMLSLAYGPSLPAALRGATIIDTVGPSRSAGGEVIDIQFVNPKTVTSVKLSAFTLSGKGSVLMHNVEATMAGNTAFALGELFSFAQKGQGLYTDHGGLIMLGTGNYVTTNVNKQLIDLKLQVEGFTANDATLLVQADTVEGLNYYDFKVTRAPVSVPHPQPVPQPVPPPFPPPFPPPLPPPPVPYPHPYPHPHPYPGNGSYYNWGQGQDGYGHCYQYASNGGVLNDGSPVDNMYCGRTRYQWGTGNDGYTHCYEYGGNYVLNDGSPVDNMYCGG